MLHDGRHKDTFRSEKGGRPVLIGEWDGEATIVTRDEIPHYINNPDFTTALEWWHFTKLWGLPNGQGWANEPMDVLHAITAIELEAKAIESAELDKVKHDSRRGQNQIHGGR